MMNEMNYRYNNPGQGVAVDKSLAEAFVSKARTSEQIESFGMWASMSKEAKELAPILQVVQTVSLEQTKQATM